MINNTSTTSTKGVMLMSEREDWFLLLEPLKAISIIASLNHCAIESFSLADCRI
jgi:hypothetical protein